MLNHEWLLHSFYTWFNTQAVLGYLLFAMTIDVMTGVTAAIRTGQLNSSIGRKGAATKTAILLGAVFVAVLEPLFSQLGYPIAQAVMLYFFLHEVESVVENLARSGVKMPPYVNRAMSKIREMQAMDQQAKPKRQRRRPAKQGTTS